MNIEGISVFNGKAIRLDLENEIIGKVTEIKNPGHNLPYLSPGFLDMQVNGYNGSDYSLEDFSAEHVNNIISSLAVSGTSQHVATFVSGPQDRLIRNLKITAEAIRNSKLARKAISGVHIEGPFISSEDGPRGAHDKKFVRDPDFAEFESWQEAAEGRISIVTLAPEREGALDFIRKVSATGVTVSIGHTGASPEEICRAVETGARLSTHLGNGSYTELPRLKNYIWEQLAADELTAGIISDSFHLPGSVVKTFARAKGLDKLVLVSDVALIGGYKPGLYKWGDLDVEVFTDGHLGLPGTSILAGAAHLLDWDLAHFMKFTGSGLAETIKLCTVNPARVIGLPEEYGKLEAGSPANICLFKYKPGDKRLHVISTFCAGQEIFKEK